MVSKSDQDAFKRFNTVALARIDEGVFLIPAEPPFWLLPFLDQGEESGGQVTFRDEFSFVANFLVDAEERWRLQQGLNLSSGVYSVQSTGSPELFYECKADVLRGEKVLLVELLGEGSPGSDHEAVRLARSQRLRSESSVGQIVPKPTTYADVYLSGLPAYEAVMDEAGGVISESCNSEFLQTLPTSSDATPNDAIQYFSAEERAQIQVRINRLIDRGVSDKWLVHRQEEKTETGQEQSIQFDLSPLDSNRVRLVVRDISEKVCADRWLASSKLRSNVTGLLDFSTFSDRVDDAVKFGCGVEKTLALLYINVEGFSGINETYSRQAGDALLTGIAERVVSNVSAVCTVFHFGADEFVVLLESFDNSDAINRLVTSLQQKLNEPYMLRFLTHNISVRLGCGIYQQDALTSDTLLAFAKKHLS